MSWHLLIAAGTAGLVTFLDIDRTFYIPNKVEQKFHLYFLVVGFVFANAFLAAAFYLALQGTSFAKVLPEWARALVVGLSYLTLVRQKFASISAGGGEAPLGLEFLYNSARYSVYKRINRIAKAARYQEAIDLADRKSLEELKQDAELSISQDALLTEEEREKERKYVNSTYTDKQSDERTRSLVLADYILSQQFRG